MCILNEINGIEGWIGRGVYSQLKSCVLKKPLNQKQDINFYWSGLMCNAHKVIGVSKIRIHM